MDNQKNNCKICEGENCEHQKNACDICGGINCNHQNNFFKDRMRFARKLVFIIIVLFGLGLIINTAVKSYGEYVNPQTITITGHGEINSIPNISTINFTIRSESKDNNTKLLQENVSNSANNIIPKLTNLGIDSKDIQTSNYNVQPKYSYNDGTSKVIGYEASESIKVKVKDTENVSKVLNILAEEKITEVSGPNYELDNDKAEEIKDQAREIAIKDAKNKANELAKELGVKIKRIVSYYDNSSNNPVYPVMYKSYGAGDMMATSPNLESANLPTGENKTEMNVSITFQMQN